MINKCKQCEYIWNGNIPNPIACPRCKRYDWNKKIKKEEKLKTFQFKG